MTTPLKRHRPATHAHEAIKALDAQCRIEGMSRRQLALKSGVPERTLADWWYGKSDPHVSLLEATLNVFKLRLKVGAMEIEK